MVDETPSQNEGDALPDPTLDAGLRSAFSRRDPTPRHDPFADDPRYRIVDELGRGGMGVVYESSDALLGRRVALKVLREDRTSEAQRVRFIEEARIASRLQHPGIVPIYDLVQGEPERAFFTMKLVDGETMRQRLDARADVATDRADLIRIFERVCQAIAYAHSRGIIHRDLKPSNVMIGPFGEVLVLDWGLAKALGDRSSHDARDADDAPETSMKSVSGSVLGTPSAMAPEQARGDTDSVDRRADVFALGAMLCEILTGRGPYDAGSTDEVRKQAADARLDGAFKRLGDCNGDQELVQLARECLAERCDDRPADGGVVAQRTAAHLTAVDDRVRNAELQAAEARARSAEERRVRRLTGTLIIGAVLVAGAGLAFWFSSAATQRAYDAETHDLVSEALVDARSAHAAARASDRDDTTAWSAAMRAADAAEAVVRSRETRHDDATKVGETVDLIRREEAGHAARRAQTALDATMRNRLFATRQSYAVHRDTRQSDREYHDAFAEYGIDVQHANAADEIRASGIRDDLIAALDDWFLKNPARKRGYQVDVERIDALSAEAGDDPWRARIRKAYRERDLDDLKAAATSDDISSLAPPALHLLTAALQRFDALPEALEVARTAWDREPGSYSANGELGLALCRQSPPLLERGLGYLIAAVACNPDSPFARVNQAVALARLGRHEEALIAARHGTRLGPRVGVTHDVLGTIYWQLERNELAERSLREAIKVQPDFARAHHNLGVFLSTHGRPTEAVAPLLDATRHGALGGKSWNSLAKLYRKLKRFDDAVAANLEAIAMNRRSPAAHISHARTLYDMLRFRDAEAAARRAVALTPRSSEPHEVLAHALRRQGAFDAAIVAMENAASLTSERNATHLQTFIVAWRAEAKVASTIDQVLAGTVSPADRPAWDQLFAHTRDLDFPAREAALWRTVARSHAPLFPTFKSRLRALRVTIRAGLARGADPHCTTPADRTAALSRAATLLTTELDRIESAIDEGATRASKRELHSLAAALPLDALASHDERWARLCERLERLL